MEVVAYRLADHANDGASCRISLLHDAYGDVHGFECEPVEYQMMDGHPAVDPTSCALNDQRNYNYIEASTSSSQKIPTRRFRKVKKLLRSLLRRNPNNNTNALRSAEECHQVLEGKVPTKSVSGDDSDCDTITTCSSVSGNSSRSSEWFEDSAVHTSEGATIVDFDIQSLSPPETKSSESNDVEMWPNPEKLLKDYFGASDAYKVQVSKAHDLVFHDDATACTAISHTSSLSSCSNPLPRDDVFLMEHRLLGTGKVTRKDFDFVPDYVSKEVLHLIDEEKKLEMEKTADKNGVSHVKTGIWEVTSFEDDGRPKETYYVVTGVSMEDRVDTKKLRKYVFAGQQHRRRPKIDMAPTDIAEGLAGYRSGTMAPICHTQNMKLFLEESLMERVDDENHRLNVGSGVFGKCLSISPKNFLAIAEANPKGLEICPIIRTAKK
jgi:prolyl-tRNA editing enzyme YbaK/EbsC (Cys-tRNA(Pro) deacylase)